MGKDIFVLFLVLCEETFNFHHFLLTLDDS